VKYIIVWTEKKPWISCIWCSWICIV